MRAQIWLANAKERQISNALMDVFNARNIIIRLTGQFEG